MNNVNIVFNSGKSLAVTKKKAKSPGFAWNIIGSQPRPGKLSLAETLLGSGKKVKPEEVFVFANQFAILLEAGVPLVSVLNILSQQTENPQFKKVIVKVTDDINGGSNLTQALAKFPKVFPHLFVSMVRAAEKGGELVAVLKQLSVYLEQQHKLNKKIKAATVYPKFVSMFFMLVLAGIIFGLVPKFQSIFESFNAELPAATQILMNISHFAKDYILVEGIVIFALVVLFRQFKNTETGVSFLDKLKLKIPVVGDLVSKVALARFSRTLSILIRSGVSLVDSLDIAGATTENVHFTRALKLAKKGVIGGETLTSQLRKSALFPIMVISMVATGEESGALEKMLTSISDLYETHVDSKVSGLSSIIEPALMIGLGAVAVIVIIALYLPIFYMSNVIN